MALSNSSWQAFNCAYIKTQLLPIRHQLLALIGEQPIDPSFTPITEERSLQAYIETATPAFERVSKEFNLSSFERNVLLLCVGFDYDPAFAALCTQVQLSSARPYPTFELALRLFPE
jgi:hypothetical protein